MKNRILFNLWILTALFTENLWAQKPSLMFTDLYHTDTIISFKDFNTSSITADDLIGYYQNDVFYFTSKKTNILTQEMYIYSINTNNFQQDKYILKCPENIKKKLSKIYFKIENFIFEKDTIWLQLYQEVLKFVHHNQNEYAFSQWIKTGCKGSHFYKDLDVLITTDASMGKITYQTYHIGSGKSEQYEFIQNYPYMTYLSPIHYTNYRNHYFYYIESDEFCLNRYHCKTMTKKNFCYHKKQWETTLSKETQRLNIMDKFYDKFNANFELFKTQPTILFSYLLNEQSILINYRNFNHEGKLQTFWDLYQISKNQLIPLAENISDKIPKNHILKNGDLFFTVTDGRCRCRLFNNQIALALVLDSDIQYEQTTFKDFLEKDNQYFKLNNPVLKLYIYKLNPQYYEKIIHTQNF